MEIVTGHTGTQHITSVDDAMFNVAMFGDGEYVLKTSDQMGYTIVSNNRVDIKPGDLMMQGRHGRIPRSTTDQCTIDNGTQGAIRHDLIVCRYTKSGEIESMTTVVKKGTQGSVGQDPPITTGDINASATVNEMPLYRVVINGLSISRVDKLFDTLPTLRRIRSGTSLPTSGVEGDIFLLREG